MSDEAPTSTSGKHARSEDEIGHSDSKKQRQELDQERDGPCSSSTDAVISESCVGAGVSSEGVSGEGRSGAAVESGADGSGEAVRGEAVASESDEEYKAGTSNSDEEYFSGEEKKEEDSTDISAEEEEEEEEEDGKNDSIMCGLEVHLREIKDGNYRLFHQQNGRELKMLISEEAISSAKKLVETKQAADIIAVLDAKGVEITKDDEDEIIVYAESLASSEKDFPYYGGEDVSNPPSDETSVLLQGNTLVVIQVDGMEDVFATGDFNDV